MTYNPADFQPGDVAMVTTWDGKPRKSQLSKSRNWCHADGVATENSVTDARPLVVLDPESDEDVERVYVAAGQVCRNFERRDVQHMLRSLTRPPKPDEPKGLGAVVVTRAGETWSRVDLDALPWRLCGDLERPIVFAGWGDLNVPPDGVRFGGVS